MHNSTQASNLQLKEACQLTGAQWAVWLVYRNGRWDFGAQRGMNKALQANLSRLILSAEMNAWLAGALSSNHLRWKKSPTSGFDCKRIYLFPNSEHRQLLLVGCDDLDKKSESVFKIITLQSLRAAADTVPVTIQDTQQPVWQVRAELEASYNPQTILDNILEYLAGVVACEAAYLAVRSGEVFRIQSTWNCLPLPQNLDLQIGKIQAIEKITTQRQGMILAEDDLAQGERLPKITESKVFSWMGIPIVIGQRVIGLVAFVSKPAAGFDSKMLQLATKHVSSLAYNVENAIVFAEATRYLQQLALLNELAVTASLSIDIHEVSRRIMQRLRRAFDIDWAAVYLLSPGENTLREYGGQRSDGNLLSDSADTFLVSATISSGHPWRVNDLKSETRFTHPDANIRSEMAAPLKYREKVIGAIDLVSRAVNAFTTQDEQLLVLIAGQLAGLFENMRLNEELRANLRQLEESQRALIQAEKMAIAGRLTASIAHEINNPLQAVSNCIHLVARKELPLEERQNYLLLAQEELDRLMQTVQRMLDFYRPGALDRKPTDIQALLNKVLSLLEKQFSDHAVRVHLSQTQNLPYVYVVGDQIQQVFLNLALNAVEAMPEGGDLLIETQCTQDTVRIIFQDTGHGVPAARGKMIFEPFVSSKQGGTGLGLAISYGIITAHGGSLELLESPIQGARFQITLKTGENV